jgi:enterochelin esterase-like enzyme
MDTLSFKTMPFIALDAFFQLAYINSNRRSRRLAHLMQADGASFILKLALLTLLLSTACNRAPTPHLPTMEVTSIPITPQLSQTPDTTPPPTSIQTQALVTTYDPGECKDQTGTIYQDEIDLSLSNQSLTFHIYLPPCYANDIDQDYPTLYMLHGIQADDSQWVDLGINNLSDSLITSGRVEPFIIIMPWHKTGLDIEITLVEELVPYIDKSYRSRSQPLWRAIGGLSRGGGSALRIGLKHPDVFGTIGLHSPATFYDSVFISLWIREISKENVPRIWVDIGKEDPLRDATLDLIALLEDLEVPFTSLLPEGDHSPAYWSTHLEEYLLWYSLGW